MKGLISDIYHKFYSRKSQDLIIKITSFRTGKKAGFRD